MLFLCLNKNSCWKFVLKFLGKIFSWFAFCFLSKKKIRIGLKFLIKITLISWIFFCRFVLFFFLIFVICIGSWDLHFNSLRDFVILNFTTKFLSLVTLKKFGESFGIFLNSYGFFQSPLEMRMIFGFFFLPKV